MAHYYFDANALIKYSTLQDYKSESGIDEIRQLTSHKDNRIYYSPLTLLECWRVFFASYRQGLFGKNRRKANKTLQIIIERLMTDLQSPPFVKLDAEMNENIIGQAHRLIERHGSSRNVGSIDMLHIALVKCTAIEMLTMVSSDGVVKNVCISENINLFDPEKSHN